MKQPWPGLGRIIEGIDEGLHHRAHNIDNPQVKAYRFLADHLPQLRLNQRVGDKALKLGSLLHQLPQLVFMPYIAVSSDRDTLILELVDNSLHDSLCRISYRIRAYRNEM
ncbi:hypothetical protein D3C75_841830 [compost metagenome]